MQIKPRSLALEGLRKMNKSTSGITLCALLALSAAGLYGQTFGEITGRVSDVTGAAVPGAAVTLTSISTNAVRNRIHEGLKNMRRMVQ